MRLIAFITEGTQIKKILDHIGVDSQPPRISPARGPPLWDDCDAQTGDGVQIEPDWDLATQAAPDYEVDQRINWSDLFDGVPASRQGIAVGKVSQGFPADRWLIKGAILLFM